MSFVHFDIKVPDKVLSRNNLQFILNMLFTRLRVEVQKSTLVLNGDREVD